MMRWHEELAHELRQAVTEGIILSVDDSGAVQTAVVQHADGVTRSQVEIKQLFGLATAPPAAGAEVTLFAVGGDPGHLVGFMSAPALRFGNLNSGEVALYGVGGGRVHIQQGGNLAIVAGVKLTMTAPTIELDGDVTVNGNLTMTGSLLVNGDLQVNGAINATGHITGH